MVYDSDYREQSITALETATPLVAQGADTPGAFIVPTNVSRITEIRITVAASVAADTNFGFTTAIHIFGSGVTLAEGWFPGPVGDLGGTAANSGSGVHGLQKYLTNIPVKPGGQFSIDGYMLGEDIGALHMLVDIVYDGPVVGRIIDMDYRSIDLTAANTLVTLTERGAAVVEGDMRPAYGEIGELFVGAGAKETAGPTIAVGLAFHISGPGLQAAGNYKFLGKGWTVRDDPGCACVDELERYVCGIKLKVGNSIRVQAQMIEGDVGTAFSVVGFAYY